MSTSNNMYKWWTADRYIRCWSVPCLLLEIKETERGNIYTILSLDDLQETNICEETYKDEIRDCTRQKFEQYFYGRVTSLRKANIELEAQMDENHRKIRSTEEIIYALEVGPTETLVERLKMYG